MPGINTGILTNASPLSTTRVEELENSTLNTGESYVYLNEDSQLCYNLPKNPIIIRDLAWNKAIELVAGPDAFTKKEYKKTSVDAYKLDKSLQKLTQAGRWELSAEHVHSAFDVGAFTLNDNMLPPMADESITAFLRCPADAPGELIEPGNRIPNNLQVGDSIMTMESTSEPYTSRTVVYQLYKANATIEENFYAFLSSIKLALMVIDDIETYLSLSMYDMFTPDELSEVYTFFEAWYTKREAGLELCGCEYYWVPVIAEFQGNVPAGSVYSSLLSYPVLSTFTNINTWYYHSTFELSLPSCLNYIESVGCESEYLEQVSFYPTFHTGTITLSTNAFSYCPNLQTVLALNNPIAVQDSAFEACHSLIAFCAPVGITKVGDYAFRYCDSLATIGPLKDLTTIGYYAFYDCINLRSITIPASVQHIEERAFAGCTSLNTIVFEGTRDQWLNITKDSDWMDNVPATYVQCSDGQLTL
jgi:hypothetical protein